GVSRKTRFGTETITVGKDKTEQFLTVTRHRGQHRWEWDLGLGGLQPMPTADGSVRFLEADHRVADLRLLPVAILTAAGSTITPAGLRWQLKKRSGAWKLEL